MRPFLLMNAPTISQRCHSVAWPGSLAIQTGLLEVLAIGHGHEGGIVHHRHLELGLVGGVDLVLIDLHVHLTHGTVCDDHMSHTGNR